MSQLTKVVTKDGEIVVHLVIDFNVNVNASGCAVTTKASGKEKIEDEEPNWEVPTFGPAPKVKFGKTESEEKR